jgi:hypothetical protein
MKRLSWKYIAGLIDGEGCIDFQFHYQKRKNSTETILHIVPRMRLALTDTCNFLLEILKTNHGGNIWHSKKQTEEHPNWHNASYWQLQGRGLRPLLQNIVNHLILKKEQAKLALWWIDNAMGKNANIGNIEKMRWIARNELKAMKADPQRLNNWAVKELETLLMRQSE